MKQKIHYLFMLLLMLLTGVGGVKAATTYKLEKVTAVEAGGLYVFEQNGHVAINTVTSSALQTTAEYQTTGLTGEENYVWELKNSTKGFKISSKAKVSNIIANTSKGNVSLNSEGSDWTFTFQKDETVLIQNPNNDNRFLGYSGETSYQYKAYAYSNLSSYPHAIVVYKLVEETGDEPVVVTAPTFSPEAGEVSQGTEVTISTATEGATIYYTIDGSTPTENSTKGSSVVINEPTTLKAIAVKEGCENSEVAEATYTIKQTIAGYAIDFENPLDAYVDWTMTNVERGNGTITAHGGEYYGTTGGKATASIQTKDKIASPGLFTCYISKTSSNTTSSTWYVQVSSDGQNWTDVTTASATNMSKGTWNEVTANLDNYSDVYVRLYYNGTTAVRTVDDISLKMASSVKVPVISLEPGSYFEAKSVTIECATDGATIYYTTDGTDPTSESTPYTDAITISETTILKAIAIKGEDASAVATAEYKIVVTEGKGTEENPFTVADARNILSEGLTPTDVYVTGIVSGIVEAYNSQYGNISYNISDDGTTEAAQLQAYRGKGKNGADFTSDTDIQVKDVVVLKGNLIDYKGTYELAADNQLVSLVRPEKAEPNLTYANAAASAVRGETFTAPVLTNPNNLTVVYSSSDKTVATVDSESGEVTLLKAGETTITASFAGNADYKEGSASYTLTVTVPSHTATFFVNGQQLGELATVAEDEAIPFPTDVAEELYGKKFVGWTTEAIDGETDDEPATLVNAATMGNADVKYYAVYAVRKGEGVSSVTTLTNANIVAAGEGKTGYNFWTITDSNGRKWNAHAVKNQHSNATSEYHYLQIKKSSESEQYYIQVPEMGGTITAMTMTVSGSSQPMTGGSNSSTLFFSNSNLTSATGNGVVSGEGASTVTLDCSSLGLNTGYITSSGAVRIWDVKVTYGTPATYSGYCTTVVAPVKPAKPIIFHDSGEYEGELKVAIAGEGTIKYTLNGGTETYTAPFTISETTTIKAWTEQDGVKSEVESKTFTIKKTEKPAINLNGYYSIKGGDGNYVNVAGRKTVTFVDKAATATAAGTVIKVETENAQVKVLRSQGVDVPGYADKAMRYVPKIVQLVAEKLGAEGEGKLLGKDGLDAIMKKFNESFDYHLYLEKAGDGYRIYGRTPSMKPVVDFYAENKANVDAKLPQLEQFINSAIQKVLQKTNGSGSSILVPFSLKTVWENMDGTLTEPVDEASTARFYEEVLSSETNVWNFAYETAMIYWTKLKEHPKFEEYRNKLGDYAKYIDKVENIRPNFKYYIVQKNGEMDIISEGNGDIQANSANTIWTLEDRTEFSVAFNEENVLNNKYYTTLYTDFAYTLPEGVKAYKVTSIDASGCFGHAATEEIGSQSIAAQTPVLLVSETSGNQTLALAETGTAVEGNWLVGPDYLINKYKIKTAQVASLFDIAMSVMGEDFYNNYVAEYEHLMLRTAGTVNNKYFFGLSKDDCKNLEEYVCMLDNTEEAGLAFANGWETMGVNKAFLTSDIYTEIRLAQVGDVDRSGDVTIADVKALVEIVLGKVTPETNTEKKYDFGAADVNFDCKTTIADVTALVNIILGKTQN